MALYFPLMVTTADASGAVKIGMFMAQRIETLDLTADNADAVCQYRISVNGLEIGQVSHRYGDGAWRLIELGLGLLRTRRGPSFEDMLRKAGLNPDLV